MCLVFKVKSPDRVLAEGTHKGFEWAIVHNGNGYRCGYVKVIPGHPWFQKSWNEIDAEVHGGLTFAEADVPCGKGEDNGWWVGFDCAHAFDARDPELPCARPDYVFNHSQAHIRTQEYVLGECYSLCEQAAAVAV
jgi:hypothetical protein